MSVRCHGNETDEKIRKKISLSQLRFDGVHMTQTTNCISEVAVIPEILLAHFESLRNSNGGTP